MIRFIVSKNGTRHSTSKQTYVMGCCSSVLPQAGQNSLALHEFAAKAATPTQPRKEQQPPDITPIDPHVKHNQGSQNDNEIAATSGNRKVVPVGTDLLATADISRLSVANEEHERPPPKNEAAAKEENEAAAKEENGAKEEKKPAGNQHTDISLGKAANVAPQKIVAAEKTDGSRKKDNVAAEKNDGPTKTDNVAAEKIDGPRKTENVAAEKTVAAEKEENDAVGKTDNVAAEKTESDAAGKTESDAAGKTDNVAGERIDAVGKDEKHHALTILEKEKASGLVVCESLTGLDIDLRDQETLESFLLNQIGWVPECPCQLEQFVQQSNFCPQGWLSLRLVSESYRDASGSLAESVSQTFAKLLPRWISSQRAKDGSLPSLGVLVLAEDLPAALAERGLGAAEPHIRVGSIIILERFSRHASTLFDFVRRSRWRFEWVAKFRNQIAIRCNAAGRKKYK